MGQISKDTYKKLVLLYLIGKYPNGVYSNYRFQKTLYFSTQNLRNHPFTYQHTQYGQYSYNARMLKDSLVWVNMIEQSGLFAEEEAGFKLSLSEGGVSRYFADLLPRISPDDARLIDRGVEEYGYLKTDALRNAAESDDLLKNTPIGGTLFEENIPDKIDVLLSDDECEDIELSLNHNLLQEFVKIAKTIEASDFDVGKVKLVASFL